MYVCMYVYINIYRYMQRIYLQKKNMPFACTDCDYRNKYIRKWYNCRMRKFLRFL